MLVADGAGKGPFTRVAAQVLAEVRQAGEALLTDAAHMEGQLRRRQGKPLASRGHHPSCLCEPLMSSSLR